MERKDKIRTGDPALQEQVVERNPGSPNPQQTAVDEHQVVTNTQTAGGLGGGAPKAGPSITPERQRLEQERNLEPSVRRGRRTRAEDEPIDDAEEDPALAPKHSSAVEDDEH